jgi:hypothetical protein
MHIFVIRQKRWRGSVQRRLDILLVSLSLLFLFLAAFAFFAFASFTVSFKGFLEVLKDFLVGDTRRDLNLLDVLSVSCKNICDFFKT